MPRPKVNGIVIDFHCHLLATGHARDWFEAADHFGIHQFVSMTPLEEVVGLLRDWGDRLHFIAVPQWGPNAPAELDRRLHTRIESFYNLGSRMVKFHAAPGTMAMRGVRLDHPSMRPLFREAVGRGMAIMTHIGDPQTWYDGKYGDAAKFGSRADHYAMWESLLEEYRGVPWVGAHMGGNPEDLHRLQDLLDRYPTCGWIAARRAGWCARSAPAGTRPASSSSATRTGSSSAPTRSAATTAASTSSPAASGPTASCGRPPTSAPARSSTPTCRPTASRPSAAWRLPDVVLQKIYHDNPLRFMRGIGMEPEGWG
jgi:hypothetical protein